MFFACSFFNASENKNIDQLANKKGCHRSNNNSESLSKNSIVCGIHVFNSCCLLAGDPPAIGYGIHGRQKHDKSVSDQNNGQPADKPHSLPSIIFIHYVRHYKYYWPQQNATGKIKGIRRSKQMYTGRFQTKCFLE